jgi:CMP-N-acetylneuraminic acid synthetase
MPYFLKETRVQDIDNIEDWKVAEFKYKYLQKKI